jgi:hypothetical protein
MKVNAADAWKVALQQNYAKQQPPRRNFQTFRPPILITVALATIWLSAWLSWGRCTG